MFKISDCWLSTRHSLATEMENKNIRNYLCDLNFICLKLDFFGGRAHSAAGNDIKREASVKPQCPRVKSRHPSRATSHMWMI